MNVTDAGKDREHVVPPTMMSVVSWKDHGRGVVDAHGDAEAAMAALVEAGVTAEEARAWTGQFVTENHQYYLRNRGRPRSLGALISSEEGDVMDDSEAEAAAGHSIVTVHAPDARAARRLVHYRANMLVDLCATPPCAGNSGAADAT